MEMMGFEMGLKDRMRTVRNRGTVVDNEKYRLVMGTEVSLYGWVSSLNLWEKVGFVERMVRSSALDCTGTWIPGSGDGLWSIGNGKPLKIFEQESGMMKGMLQEY